jgi:hypothetical protein
MGDSIPAVGRFTSEGETTVTTAIEFGPEDEQLADAARTILGDSSHYLGIAQAGTGFNRVPRVAGRRIIDSYRSRHPPLGEWARASLRKGGLADHQDLTPTGMDCGAETRHTPADDQHLCAANLLRCEDVSPHASASRPAADLEHPID